MGLLGTKLAANSSHRGFGDQLYDLSGQRPSLDLNFAENKSLVDATTGQNLVTFTRASSGTYVDSQGAIRTAVTNLLLRSEEFNDASWTKTRSSVTANAITAPNGTLTGDKLIDSTDASTSHFISQSISFVSGTTYTTSIFAKQGEIRFLRLGFNATPFGTTQVVFFDLLNGAVSSNPNALAASITNAGDGWWRLAVTATATSTASDLILVNLSLNGTSSSFTGTGTSGIFLWGAQLEQSTTVGEYIPTTSTINSAPRFDHNPTTGESLGLLVEEPRTNLVQQSDNFSDVYWVKTDMTITANESTAPDGTLTADLLTNTSASAALNNNITKDTTIRTYTASLWVKSASTSFTMTLDNGGTANRGRAQFNLSTNNIDGVFTQGTFTNTSATLTPFPDGWVRLTLTTTTSTGTTVRFRPFFTTAGATARIWGAQVEEGAFPTSYIPTTTATVTRSADVASITGANFSSWYNQTEGTVFAEFMPRTFSQACGLLSLDDGTTSERLQTRLNTSGNGTFVVADGGSVQANFGTTASASLNTKGKLATSFAANSFKASLNGGSVASDTSGTLPTVTQAVIGNAVGASIFNGPLSRITFWPKELSESTLQQVTQ